MFGKIDGVPVREHNTLVTYRALAKVHEPVGAEYGSAWFMPAAIRHLVDNDGSLFCLQVPTMNLTEIPAFDGDVEPAVMDGEPAGAGHDLVDELLEVACGIELEDTGGWRRAGGPCTSALADVHGSVPIETEIHGEGEPHQHRLDRISLRHVDIARVYHRARFRGEILQRLSRSLNSMNGHDELLAFCRRLPALFDPDDDRGRVCVPTRAGWMGNGVWSRKACTSEPPHRGVGHWPQSSARSC